MTTLNSGEGDTMVDQPPPEQPLDPYENRNLPFKPQKEIRYNRLLPYCDQLDSEALEYYGIIKSNLSRGLLLSDPSTTWVYELSKYLSIYGRFFPKEDHLYYIRFLFEVIQIPTLELSRIMTFTSVLTALLKKRELLSREDLLLDWKPLYELYERNLYSSKVNFMPEGFDTTLKSLIRASRVYFPTESTQDMLDQFRPYLCPFDISMSKGLLYMELFLPTVGRPEDQNKGFKLWLEELMGIWDSNPNSPSWEQNLIWLFARLSHDCIGQIDWSPWIPKIFTHLLKSFNLQGGTHKVQIKRNYTVFDVNAVVLWIVSMLGGDNDEVAMSHVELLFKSLESFYHPSNIGNWNTKLSQLLYKLPSAFVRRLHRERYKKATWETVVPVSHRLSEKTITRFVNALIPIINISMFSRYGSGDSAFALQHLSCMRPELVIPPLLEKLYASFDTVTEPHRLIASLQCAVSVARSMVSGGRFYPEGPSNVLPLLLASMPAIDANDVRKSIVTFQFISTFSTLIPIVDCSAAVDSRQDLSQVEYDLCLATAQLENFVLQFMDRCFALIENSAYEHRPERQDNEGVRLNAEEGITEIGLSSTFSSILAQSSPKICEAILDKLYSFVANRIFETKVAGKLMSSMVGKAAKACPEMTCRKFIPHFSRLILALTETEDMTGDEKIDEELLFSLQLLSEIVKCNGQVLLLYKTELSQVLESTLHLTSRKGYALSHALLSNTLRHLTTLYLLEFKCSNTIYDDDYDYSSGNLPIREWGIAGNINDLNVHFHVPSGDEMAFAHQLLETFVRKELNFLNGWAENESSEDQVSRETLRKSLNLIYEALSGCSAVIPIWDGDEVILNDSPVQPAKWRIRETGAGYLTFSGGLNVRETVARSMRRVLQKILKTSEDDTKSLNLVIRIYHLLMFNYGMTKSDFDTRWKSFHMVKRALENKLVGMKKHIRPLILDRIMLQHELRIRNRGVSAFTTLHQEIMDDLVVLCVSHYSEVRQKAQETLNSYFGHFSFAYRLVVPPILQLISKGSDSNHESFKGALYVLLGKRGRSILTVSDWETVRTIWLAVVDAKHSEKPSILKLLGAIREKVSKYFETITVEYNLPKSVASVASEAWSLGFKPQMDRPSDGELKSAQERIKRENCKNLDNYNQMVNGIVKLIDDHSLHWRFVDMAFSFLQVLIRFDLPYPTSGVRTMVNGLINDSLDIRKMCIGSMGAILSTQKRPHVKKVIEPPEGRNSNNWLQFNRNIDYSREEIWKSTPFIFKPYVGFYCYPKEGIKVIDFDNEPRVDRRRDDLSPGEQAVYDFFDSQENVDKLMKFLSLEEKKGSDKFNTKRFQMFKGLFINFGPVFMSKFEPLLKQFVKSPLESQQRCACEIMAGMMRGSRHWPFEENSRLKSFMTPLMTDALNNLTQETWGDWGTMCATCFEREDGRRISWMVNLISQDPLSFCASNHNSQQQNCSSSDGQNGVVPAAVLEKATAFHVSARIYCLLGVVQQLEWRAMSLLQYLTSYLLADQHLTQSFQVVRERIGVLLTNIFVYDVTSHSLPDTLSLAPKRDEFIDIILPQLEPIMKDVEAKTGIENGDSNTLVVLQSPERKAAGNLLKVISKWIIQNFSKNSCSASTGHFKVLPILCQAQSETNDEELMNEALFGVVVMSHTMLSPEGIRCALESSHSILSSRSWRARGAIGTFLQYMVSTNLFTIMTDAQWVSSVTQIVLSLLEDERVEVREAGASTFGGLIHCEFIKVDDKITKWLEVRSEHKLRRVANPNNPHQVMMDPSDVVTRHSGILGWCSIVNAYPYDVPDFMPKILMRLADHLHDPPPIPATIKKTMNSFKRTHLDNWEYTHKLKFNEDELAELANLLVSPTYYA